MRRITKLAGIALAAALTAGGLTAGSASAAPAAACSGSKTVTGTLADGATYLIQCPAGAWNGTLFLYSHGYVVPGSANPPQDVTDPVTEAWLLGHGYALAGSSYATTGWAVQSALSDQISTLNVFAGTYGKPSRTIAWGVSLGGMITAGLIQDYPNRFSAALPLCGVLSGGVATWNTALDAAFAFQQLIDPSVQVVNIKKPRGQPGQCRSRGRGRADNGRRPGPARPRGGARRHARLVHPAVGRTRGDRLRCPGAEPVPVGHRGDLPVRLRLPR